MGPDANRIARAGEQVVECDRRLGRGAECEWSGHGAVDWIGERYVVAVCAGRCSG